MTARPSPHTPLSARHPAVDFLLVLAALGAANWFWQRADLGWLGLAPSPWLLLPLLLGLRWGFGWGVVGGLAAVGVALGGAASRGETVRTFWQAHTWTLTAFPLVGALAGEVASLVARRSRQALTGLTAAEEKLRQLSTERDLLAETRQQLQQRLALVGADAWALDERVAALASGSPESRSAGLLRLLRDTCGVVEASIYRPTGNGPLQLVTRLGADAPDSLSPEQSPIAALALAERRTVTVRDLLDAGTAPVNEPHLAALLLGSGDVLLVGRMAFESITARTFARMETIVARLA